MRGIAFRFRYYGPRARAGLLMILLLACPWFIAHPQSFDVTTQHGTGYLIDLILQASPNLLRVFVCFWIENHFAYMLMTYYVPCMRSEPLVLFDGRELRGFRAWGREGSVLLSEVERVTYRGGSAVVRGGKTWLWLPLSFLELDHTQRQAVRTMLDEAAS